MSETRDKRLAAELMRCASEFISAHANRASMITVTNAAIGNDGAATVYITTLPEDKEEQALAYLKRMQPEFWEYVKTRIRTKRMPRIAFAIDSGEKKRQHLDTLLQDTDTSAE